MSANDKIVSRVRKLLAKAADSAVTEEEARSFAVEAARLMREHDLRVDVGDEVRAPRRPTPRPEPPPPPYRSAYYEPPAFTSQWRHVPRMGVTVPCALGCSRPIRRGEEAWHKLGTGDFIHEDWSDCGPGA